MSQQIIIFGIKNFIAFEGYKFNNSQNGSKKTQWQNKYLTAFQ